MRLVVLMMLGVLGVITVAGCQVQVRQVARDADPCGTASPPAPVPSMVSGYWVAPRTDLCDWQRTVAAIQRTGGDTMLQIGPRLRPRRLGDDGAVLAADGSPDPAFTGCQEGARSCHDAALAALRAANPNSTIVQTYTYESYEAFGSALLRCPAVDRRVSPLFTRVLLPVGDPGDTSCDLSRARSYRLVIVRGTTTDSPGAMLSQADKYKMQVFVGLPAPAGIPGMEWEVDPAHRAATLGFTRLVLRDYAARHGGHASLRGVYQSFEMSMHARPDPSKVSVLGWYRDQHAVVREELPGKKIAVSPYWDARRKRAAAFPPGAVRGGFVQIADTGADVIIPQDSRGTGKVGLFWPHQAGGPVDSRLEPVEDVGRTTYGRAYYGSTTDYYQAAAMGRADYAARSGRKVELWANLEGFEPTRSGAACGASLRGRTDKQRMDQAVTFGGTAPSKIVSYIWDPLYTCVGGRSKSLAEEIAADWNRPTLVGALKSAGARPDQATTSGLLVRGYQLAAGTVELTWCDSAWKPHSTRVEVAEKGWHDPGFGANNPAFPDRLEQVWVPFSWADMAPDFWIHINLTNRAGKRATHQYSLAY